MSTEHLDTGPRPEQALTFSYETRGDRLIGLGLINGVLNTLTLGVYSFWAKTEVRRRLWSFLRINGEPLTYTGTGRELMLGFTIAFLFLGLPLLLVSTRVAMMGGLKPGGAAAIQFLIYVLVFFLFGNAVYRAQRYRLSRSLWRGIRGALVGSPNSYGWTYFWTLAAPFAAVLLVAGALSWLAGPQVGGVLIVFGLLTVFWVLPWRANKLRGLLTADMRFGNQPLRYTGTAAPLYKQFAVAWAGSAIVVTMAVVALWSYLAHTGLVLQWQVLRVPPNLGQMTVIVACLAVAVVLIAIITASYRAAQYRHFATNTWFESGHFNMAVSGAPLAWIVASNYALLFAAVIAAVLFSTVILNVFGLLNVVESGGVLPPAASMISSLLIFASLVVATTVAKTLAMFRMSRYLFGRLSFTGGVDLEAVLQSQQKQPKLGEGLAQVFDIDGF